MIWQYKVILIEEVQMHYGRGDIERGLNILGKMEWELSLCSKSSFVFKKTVKK